MVQMVNGVSSPLVNTITKIKQIKRNLEFWWFYKNFYNHFFFYTTEQESELKELFKIRYRVYCEEYNYISKENTKNGLEKDEWDSHSTHFIIRDEEKEIAATVRMILNSDDSFPLLGNFKIDVDTSSVNLSKAAEISRLIVTKKYRRHHLLLVLIKGMYLFVKEKGLENVFSVMDDKLLPMLTKIGLPFRKIGPPSIYQGLTYPCMLNVKEFEICLQEIDPRLLKFISEGVIKYDGTNHKYSVS